MEDAIIIRENCIGITYNLGEIHASHYEKIIEKLLGVPESEIEGIDDRNSTRFLFQVSTNERYQLICETFTGRDITLDNHCIIQIDDISSYGTRVELSNVPFAITNDKLSTILQKFGVVYKCMNYCRTFGKYKKLNKSGDRLVWMKINQHIPQTLFINRTDTNIYTQYPNQPMSCNNCGHSGHRVRFCSCEPKDFKNLIDIKQSDLVNPTPNSEFDNSDDDRDYDDYDDTFPRNTNANNIDIHIEPSQNENPFECTECDYKCKYSNIFNEHMQTHTGENPIKCDVCELISNGRAAFEEHSLLHSIDPKLKCSECTYECLNQTVLYNHLKTHNIYACEKCVYKSNTLKGLNGHVKVHNLKNLKCSKCDLSFNATNKLNTHMETHTGDEIFSETLIESAKSPQSEKSQQNSNLSKRGLSVSPEVVDSNKKSKKHNSKKSVINC